MASRFGLLHLARQVCVDARTQRHTLPGNPRVRRGTTTPADSEEAALT